MNDNHRTEKELAEDQIDILNISKTIWESRRLIFKVTGAFFFIGLFIALLSPTEFTANSTFVPQTEKSGTGKIGGLASLAGIDLGGMGTTSEIPPSLYPRIVTSIRFKRALLEVPVTPEGENTSTTYREYYENIYSPGTLSLFKKYTIGLPGTILKGIRGDGKDLPTAKVMGHSSLTRVSQEELEHFERLEGQLSVVPNDKEGTVELKFIMPEALMAAEMAKASEELLQKEVIAYKIQNAREQLNFTKGQFEEKKSEFKQKQKELATFRDRNQNIASALAMNQMQSLETEYNFAYSLYTELAKQYEHSKLQVSKDTPVFAVINPVSIPAKKSAPKRAFILIVFTLLGGVLALGFVFVKRFIDSIREEWEGKKKET